MTPPPPDLLALAKAWVDAAVAYTEDSPANLMSQRRLHIANLDAAAAIRAALAANAAEIERLRTVDDLARDLAMIWRNWKISGLPRSHRNAKIDELRQKRFTLYPAQQPSPVQSDWTYCPYCGAQGRIATSAGGTGEKR
jgi:hypothetical protein